MQHNDQNTKHRDSTLSCSEYLKYWKQRQRFPSPPSELSLSWEMQKCSSFLSWQKDKKTKRQKYNSNLSRGSQGRWELAAFPHKSPSIVDYIIGVHLFTQIWFIKVFISHTNTMRIEIHNITHWAIPAQKISLTERCMEYVSKVTPHPNPEYQMATAPTEHYWLCPHVWYIMWYHDSWCQYL